MAVLMSLWQNDADRQIHARVEHLLSKICLSAPPLRWLWAVGDSADNTELILRSYSDRDPRIQVVRYDSGLIGMDTITRRRRSGFTASGMFMHVTMDDLFACLHESDLRSPADVVDRLLGPEPTAAWPIIRINGRAQFYDTWAFRDVTNTYFGANDRLEKKTEVASFGSVWVAPAHLVRDRKLVDNAIVDLCTQWRNEGIRLFVDPSVTVEQPVELWSPC